jgi:uncharacterized membrane protein YecN with MAPEG domain
MIWVMLHVVSRQWMVEYICSLILIFVRLLVGGLQNSPSNSKINGMQPKYQIQIPDNAKSAAAALKL